MRRWKASSRTTYDSPPRNDDSSQIAFPPLPCTGLMGATARMRDTPACRADTQPPEKAAMRTYRTAILASILAASSVAITQAHAERVPTRYFDLVNASHDSVTMLAVATTGGADFREIEFDAPLKGGVNSTTVELPDGDCLRDFRAVFADGRALLYPGIDVCRYHRLRLIPRDGRSQ